MCLLFNSLGRCSTFALFVLSLAGQSVLALPIPVRVTIHQLEDVRQGKAGEFAVEISPQNEGRPVLLRVACLAGTGRASFADGSTEIKLTRSGRVPVLGITGNDFPGALTLTAWIEGTPLPVATAF